LAAPAAPGAAAPELLAAPARVTVPIDWEGYRGTAVLVQGPEGLAYEVRRSDGTVQTLDPATFAARTLEAGRGRSWLERLFNVSSLTGVAWVLFGLFGQVLFAGRMVVQWLVSERQKRSVIPPVFWWMSLGGGAILFSYFAWRQDIVGMLGQGLGIAIYVRNLMLLHRRPRSAPDEAAAEASTA
jgi:lipid-A-disaccharide synthase-like uncharacterized protein